MNNNLLLGAKFYAYDEDDNIEIFRVCKYCSSEEVQVYSENNRNEKFKISILELQQRYVQLNPHAIINFCIAKVGDNLDDVIVTMHKMSDLTSNEPTPYCVCRQNITDLFANQIITNKMYVGCSMSLDTCPPDVDYRMMIACNGIKKRVSVCIYMDDTLDDILSMIQTKDFDNALASLFADYVKYEVKTKPHLSAMKDRIMKLDTYDGYCKTLRLLLELNNFIYDYYSAFHIIPITEEVKYNEENGALDQNIVDIISDIFQVNITSTLCIPYWYDIDLGEIDNDYTLIIDKNNKLYVIGYVSNGSKHIEIENIESEENVEKMANSTIGTNKSVKEASEYIRFNKNKYK